MTTYFSKCGAILGVFVVMFITTGKGVNAHSNELTQKKTQINVGIYAPFSNESAFIGRNMLGAMELAYEQLKSPVVDYEFFTLDKLSNNIHQADLLQKFIEVHHINVLVTEGADSSALVAPLAQKNKLIHFCLTSEAINADGKNTFRTQSPNHKSAAVLNRAKQPKFIAQFKREYFSHPITEAGYAFDIFHLLNSSVVATMNNRTGFSSEAIAKQLLSLESGTGIMGLYHLDKKGVLYNKETLVASK